MSFRSALEGRLSLPAMAAPMFIVSNPQMVIAQCTAGVVGSFPALNARPETLLDAWLGEIEEALARHDAAHPESPSAPFAVNLIVHRSNSRLEHDLAACVKHRVPIIVTSLGAREEVNHAVHAYGGTVLHDVIDNRFAHKAIEKGADGLIAVAAGAGGHAGTQSPLALLQDIRAWFDGPLLLSGAIASGRSLLAAQVMGADLGYIGSAFIATHEANAVPEYKQMICEASGQDIVYSSLFTGVHGNYLRASIERAGLDPDDLPEGHKTNMNFGSGGSKAKAWKDVWGAGQGIGPIHQVVRVSELIARLRREYREAADATVASMQTYLRN